MNEKQERLWAFTLETRLDFIERMLFSLAFDLKTAQPSQTIDACFRELKARIDLNERTAREMLEEALRDDPTARADHAMEVEHIAKNLTAIAEQVRDELKGDRLTQV